MNPGDKRLAIMTEDHPLEYAQFEGVIPAGNYGAGPMVAWDRGYYRVIEPPGADASTAASAGKLDLELHGFKLQGAFTLVRTGMKDGRRSQKENWLFIKKRDEYATSDDITALRPRSVLSGLTAEELREAPALTDRVAARISRDGAPRLAGDLRPGRFPLSLATLAPDPVEGSQWIFELKYDGIRALAIRDGADIRISARSGTIITSRYPELSLALQSLPFDRVVLDGEIVAIDDRGRPSFQLLQRRMHVEGAAAAERLSISIPVTYYVFDLLAFDGFDLRPLALAKRKAFLRDIIRNEGPLRYSDHVETRGRAFFDAVAEAGMEGIIAKRRDSPYRGKRTTDWLKIKCPLTRHFVIGGYTRPAGSRTHFGALLLGLFEADGSLRFVGKVGTGFSDRRLGELHEMLGARARATSPFRPARNGERVLPEEVHFCEPELVCDVRFLEATNDSCVRQPSFLRLVPGADPRECLFEHPFLTDDSTPVEPALPEPQAASTSTANDNSRTFKPNNLDKVFWPKEGYTKGDLIDYYRSIAKWMLPYLKDRPVILVRYPDGITGKSFFQRDAPGFVPKWIRTEKLYSDESHRDIAYLIIESEDALAYIANLGTIPIHMWSSRIPHLERPDWLLFDIDPKGTTTEKAVKVALETIKMLRKLGLRPVVKTSGQAGIHVVVGLEPRYTYEHARGFAELVAQLVVSRVPKLATVRRDVSSREGRVYIDYLQLGYGKTIVATFAVRPIDGAPVSAPIRSSALTVGMQPGRYNIKTMARYMARMRRDPFIGALRDQQTLEQALPALERELKGGKLFE